MRRLSSLDPKAFNAAIRAAEQSVAVDAPRIRDIVATVLDGGRLAVPRLDAAVTITAGQASIGQTTVLGQGADLSISGNADLADASIDARLTLTGPTIHEGANSIRPEILVTLKGPYSAPKRSIDVSALSGWLMLRSVERQAKQISAIEAERREIERREAERRDAERREAEKREAERQEAERKAAESKPAASSIPAALPVPQIMEEPPGAAVARYPSAASAAARCRAGANASAAAEYRAAPGRHQTGAAAAALRGCGRAKPAAASTTALRARRPIRRAALRRGARLSRVLPPLGLRSVRGSDRAHRA